MAFIFENNINTTLASSVSSGATSITLSSSANLPGTIAAGQTLVVTLNDAATRQNFEVLYATAVTGATLTVIRAREGTSALSWNTGDFAYSGSTSGQMAAFGQLAATQTWTGANTFNDPVVVAAGTVSGDAVNLGQFASQLTQSFYKKVADPNSPTGYMIYQGNTGLGGQPATISFPTAFSNFCLGVVINEGAAANATWGTGKPTVHAVSNLGTASFDAWTLSWNGASPGAWIAASNTFFYLAWGY